MSRQKNSINNLVWGMIGTIVTSIVAIIIPRLFILTMGQKSMDYYHLSNKYMYI